VGRRASGGEGFRAIQRLLGSAVEYRRMDAFELNRLGERFDLVYCFGILHRVKNLSRPSDTLTNRPLRE
jgi:2-polyprenyl-3-methyl-5-hydroxy-6-metoxy-1,4-benzoquinol methylase